MEGHEVPVFLIAERFDRSRVEGLPTAFQGEPGGELSHHRLPGPRRRGDQNRGVLLERSACGALELVEGEPVAALELRCEAGHRLTLVPSRLRRRPWPFSS